MKKNILFFLFGIFVTLQFSSGGEPADAGSNAWTSVIAANDSGDIKKQFDKCSVSKDKNQQICQAEAEAYCAEKGNTCDNIKNQMYFGSVDIEINEKMIRDIIKTSTVIPRKISNQDVLAGCLNHFIDKDENNQEYFKEDILEFIREKGQFKPKELTPYTSLRQCESAFGEEFIDETEERLSLVGTKEFCSDLILSVEVYQVLENNIRSGGSSGGPLVQAGNACFVKDSTASSAETYDNTHQDECLGKGGLNLEDLKTVDASTNAGYKEYNRCMEHYNNVASNQASKSVAHENCVSATKKAKGEVSIKIKQQVNTLIGGCVSLHVISQAVIDEEMKGGEDDYQSVDSKIKCMSRRRAGAPYALDYGACKDAAYWYNGTILTSNLAAPVIMGAIENSDQIGVQGDMQRDLAAGGVVAQNAAYRAQRRSYQNKANSEATKGALETGKAMAMFGNMMMYPTPKYVSEEWCANSTANDYDLDRDFACGVVYMAKKNKNIKKDLFANVKVHEFMLGVGAQALSKAVVHAIVSGTYKKQAKLVGKVENALANAAFNQPENQLDLSDTYCANNPTVPSCMQRGTGSGVSTGVDFNFDGIAAQTTGSADFDGNGDSADYSSSNGDGKPTTDQAASDLSDITGTGSDSKFDSKKFKEVGAAGIKAAGGGGSGGGGGGGGASGGGGGGSGDGPAKKGGPAGQKDFGKKITGNYAVGGVGKFSSGGKISKKRKSNNPFANMSGKRRSRKIASQVEKQLLPKKSKLFEVISKRYADVHKKGDRLLKTDPNFQ